MLVVDNETCVNTLSASAILVPDRVDVPSDSLPGFEDGDLVLGVKKVRSHQPRYATTNDCDAHFRPSTGGSRSTSQL